MRFGVFPKMFASIILRNVHNLMGLVSKIVPMQVLPEVSEPKKNTGFESRGLRFNFCNFETQLHRLFLYLLLVSFVCFFPVLSIYIFKNLSSGDTWYWHLPFLHAFVPPKFIYVWIRKAFHASSRWDGIKYVYDIWKNALNYATNNVLLL